MHFRTAMSPIILATLAVIASSLLGCYANKSRGPRLPFDEYRLIQVPASLPFPSTPEEAWIVGDYAVNQVDPDVYPRHFVHYNSSREAWFLMTGPPVTARGFPGYTLLIEKLGFDGGDKRCFVKVIRTE